MVTFAEKYNSGLVEMAEEMLEYGRYTAAIKAAELVVDFDNRNGTGWRVLAECNLAFARAETDNKTEQTVLFSRALDSAKSAVAIFNEDVPACVYATAAKVNYFVGNYDDA